MADKYIKDLPKAVTVNSSDNFVIDQGNVAKRLPGSYYNDLINSRISKPKTNPNGSQGQVLRSNGNGETGWIGVQDLPSTPAVTNSDVIIVGQNGVTKRLPASYYNDIFNSKVNKPRVNPNGSQGQVLRSNGNGETEWIYTGTPTDEQVREVMESWLEDQNVKNLAFLEYVVVT